jgi:hypothetical protein
MKKYLAAAAFALALAQPASAITFSSLTTIYVGTGVKDDGEDIAGGTATVFHCINVSGVSTSVRFLVLAKNGSVEKSAIRTVPHGGTATVSTRTVFSYDVDVTLGSPYIYEGGVNIESLQSGVFCNAKTIDALADFPDGVILPLVRVNPHPGTVE